VLKLRKLKMRPGRLIRIALLSTKLSRFYREGRKTSNEAQKSSLRLLQYLEARHHTEERHKAARPQ
jgi:hypothetical protein